LLQRKEDQEDYEAIRMSGAFPIINISSPHTADEFILQAPPRHARTTEDNTSSNDCNNRQQQQTTGSPGQGTALATPRTSFVSPTEVSSLFSLKHPLDDVLPLSYWSQDDSLSTLVTDAFEKILHTSNMCWTDNSDPYLVKQFYKQPICVTYNTILKR